MRGGRSETSTHDLGDGAGTEKDGGKISRRQLANALLVGAGVRTSIVRVLLKRAKAAEMATAKETVEVAVTGASAVVQTTPSSVPSRTSAPNTDGALTVVDSTDQRPRFSAHEKASPGLRFPAVGVRTKRVFLARHGQVRCETEGCLARAVRGDIFVQISEKRTSCF